jgi:hypothetical protein
MQALYAESTVTGRETGNKRVRGGSIVLEDENLGIVPLAVELG